MNPIKALLPKLNLLPTTGCRFVAVSGYTDQRGEKSNYTVNVGVSYGNAKELDKAFLGEHLITDDDITEFAGHLEGVKNLPEADMLLENIRQELDGTLPDEKKDIVTHPSYPKFKELLMEGASTTKMVAAWLLQEAQTDLLKAMVAPDKASQNRSEGQTNAYKTIAPGMKFHTETGEIYLVGSRISKRVVEKAEKEADTRKPLTKAKDFIRKKYLRTADWRQFIIGEATEITMNGDTIVISQKPE